MGANKTLQLQRVTLTPTVFISSSSEDTSGFSVNETVVLSKSANLSCILNSTKSQNLNKHQIEQTITETENLRAEKKKKKKKRNDCFKITCCGPDLHRE